MSRVFISVSLFQGFVFLYHCFTFITVDSIFSCMFLWSHVVQMFSTPPCGKIYMLQFLRETMESLPMLFLLVEWPVHQQNTVFLTAGSLGPAFITTESSRLPPFHMALYLCFLMSAAKTASPLSLLYSLAWVQSTVVPTDHPLKKKVQAGARL